MSSCFSLLFLVFNGFRYRIYILDEAKNATDALEKWNTGEWIFPASEWKKIQLADVKPENFDFEKIDSLLDFERVENR